MVLDTSIKDKRATLRFISLEQDFNEVHNNFYTYSNAVYSGVKHKLLITCKHHGDFLQTPAAHLSGKGCNHCSIQRRTKEQSQFINESSAIHNGYYDYSEVLYIQKDTKVIITCPIHGNFNQRPGSHLQGHGCINCKISSNTLYLDEPTIVYYIRINAKQPIYKIGITIARLGIEKRFKYEDIIYEVIFEKLCNTGKEAFTIEQRVLREYLQWKYNGPDILKNGGNSELFTRDILGLNKENYI